MVNSTVTNDNTINSQNVLTDGLIDINDVIDRCKTCNEKTSTGPDLVHAKLIKSTNHNFHYALYIIFNYSWIHGVLPQDWKDSIIVPIYKNGEKTEGKNYRPISITSVIVRIFERVLYGRYLNLVKDKINNMQAGFRKHHTCYDHLYQMYESISSTFVKKSKLPIVFLDIEKAYDSVWQNGLLFKLNKIGITGNAWRWIKSFISNRRFKVLNYDTYSDWYDVNAGVPQGSVLSPLLFLIYINDLLEPITLVENASSNVKILLFADDIAIIPFLNNNDNDINKLFIYLDKCLNHISIWARRWKIKFSFNKSAYVIFARKKDKFKHNLYLCNHRLKQVKSYKYLGVILDSRGTFHEQSTHIITKATRASFMVNKLINKNYSPTPKIIKLLTNAIIRSVISYGIIFYIPNNKTINILNNMLLQPLRYIGLLPRNSHKVSLALEFNIPTFNIIKQIEIFRFYKRILTLPDTHPSKILYTNNININTINYKSFKWPSFQELLLTTKNQLNKSHNILLKQNIADINTLYSSSIELCTQKTLNLIYHHLLIVQCQSDKAQGIKKYMPNLKHFNKIDIPMYLQHDENNICRLRLRLRMNRAKTSNLLHIYDKNVSQSCPSCGHPYDNIQHVILDCPKFNTQRQECIKQIFKILNVNNPRVNMQIILGFVDTYNIKIRTSLLDVTASYLNHIIATRTL
jgi:hypothetical protein